jgi:hypothetical protein
MIPIKLSRPLRFRLCALHFAFCALLLAPCAYASLATPVRWIVERSRPARVPLAIQRGESVDLLPTFQDYGTPVAAVSNATTIALYYKDAAHTNVYAVMGAATTNAGQICIPWTPAAELTNSAYLYWIIVSGAGAASIRQEGTITMLANWGSAAPASNPAAIYWGTAWGTVNGDVTNQADLVAYIASQISGSTSGVSAAYVSNAIAEAVAPLVASSNLAATALQKTNDLGNTQGIVIRSAEWLSGGAALTVTKGTVPYAIRASAPAAAGEFFGAYQVLYGIATNGDYGILGQANNRAILAYAETNIGLEASALSTAISAIARSGGVAIYASGTVVATEGYIGSASGMSGCPSGAQPVGQYVTGTPWMVADQTNAHFISVSNLAATALQKTNDLGNAQGIVIRSAEWLSGGAALTVTKGTVPYAIRASAPAAAGEFFGAYQVLYGIATNGDYGILGQANNRAILAYANTNVGLEASALSTAISAVARSGGVALYASGTVVSTSGFIGNGAGLTNLPADAYATDSWHTVTTVASAPTVSITRAMGRYVAIALTNNTVLAASLSTFPSNGASFVNVALYLPTNSLTWDVATIATNNAPTLSTSVWNSIILHRGYGQTNFTVR